MSATTRRRRGVIATSSWLAIGLALAGGEAAFAQQAPAETSDVADVVVTGTRASLQSAISRKRAAATNVDSIVAEDVAAFPDKNVGEALQRVTGVSLTRDFGEGSQVSIRGVEPDLNRIEINGLSVLGNTETGARAGKLQELASELIASIDVFKGFTADMTEGGVGGTVSIKTRRPLDLRSDLLVATGTAQYLDVAGDWTFRGNLTAGKKFWDDRFGVILNVTYNDNQTRGHFLRGTSWGMFAANDTTGASGDFDNSPEKTYVDQNYANIATKQECPTGTNANACLNQWNEHLPLIPRYGIWDRHDKRTSGQLVAEYRVSDNLRTFVEYTLNNRDAVYSDFDFQFQADAAHRVNATTYDRNGVARSLYTSPRPVVVDEDHNLVDFYLAPTANTPAAGLSANQGSAGAFRTTHRSFGFLQRSQYLQAGFNWKSDRLNIDGIVATQRAENVDDTNFLNYLSNIPNIHVQVNPENGVPTFSTPAGMDFNDPVSLATPAVDSTGAIVQTVGIQSQYQPKEGDLGEDTAKLDVDWYVDGFINKVEFGYQGRKSTSLRYAPNGYTTFDPADPTRAPIYVQGAFINYNLNMVPGLTVSGPAQYSYDRPAVNGVQPLLTTGAVTVTQAVTQADILAFMQAVNQQSPGEFWKGGPNQGVTLPTSWFAPDVTQLDAAGLVDTSQWNHNFVRRAPGRNELGQIVGEFDQTPSVDTEENIHAVYGQVSFEGDFFGMTLKGNSGVRVIKSEVIATGAISEQLRPASGPLTQGRTRIYTINKSYTDALPTFNVALDITDKLVARFGYAKLLARPKINDLLPNGTCIFNDLTTGSDFPVEDSCSLGNPALNPYRANSYDLSVGYYWNRDTLLNVALFQKDLVTFTLGRQLVTGVDVFNDGNLIDVTMPVNGSGATQRGIEVTAQTAFTWLPAPFDGFGVQTNYTYAEASNVGLFDTLTGEELTQAGLSKNTYNVILYYDKGPINARLAYNARTPYFTGGGTAGRAGRRAGTEYLDGKFTYEINEHLSTFVEAQNLTGEIETSYGGSIRINERSYSGKRFFIGATYKY